MSKKRCKSGTLAALLTVMAFAWGITQAADAESLKIGYVDVRAALNESDTGKKAKTELEGMIKARQGAIDEKGKAIEKLKADLDKQASVLSADAKKAKEDEIERLMREYQRMAQDAQTELKKKESEFTVAILKELKDIVDKIGQEEGYTVIFENTDGIILYAKKEAELTDKVVKRYNEAAAAKQKGAK